MKSREQIEQQIEFQKRQLLVETKKMREHSELNEQFMETAMNVRKHNTAIESLKWVLNDD